MFGDQVKKAAEEHAKYEFPREACGLVVDNTYVPRVNIHPQPKLHFRMDSDTWLRYPNIQAVIHSHTSGVFYPTGDDIQGQMNTAVPWGLLHTNGQDCTPLFYWGHGVETPPLLRREFRWGPSGTDKKGDCYALIKDYFKLEQGIELPEYPRDAGAWREGGSLFGDYFKDAGFTEIYREELQPGDVLLFRWEGEYPHHGGVYTGNSLFLHHVSSKLSSHDIVGRYDKYITHYLRYNKVYET